MTDINSGGKVNGYKNTGMKKVILGKERCIYKIAKDRKEYVKYKGELVTVKSFKEAQKPLKKTVGGEPSDAELLDNAMDRYYHNIYDKIYDNIYYHNKSYDDKTGEELNCLNQEYFSETKLTVREIQTFISNIRGNIRTDKKKLQNLNKYFEYIYNNYKGDLQVLKDDVIIIKDHIEELLRRHRDRRVLTINDKIKRFYDMNYIEEKQNIRGEKLLVESYRVFFNEYMNKNPFYKPSFISDFKAKFDQILMNLYNGKYNTITTFESKEELTDLIDFFTHLKGVNKFPAIIKQDISDIKKYIDGLNKGTYIVYDIKFKDNKGIIHTINGIILKKTTVITYLSIDKLIFEKDGVEHFIIHNTRYNDFYYGSMVKENIITEFDFKPVVMYR